MRIEYFGDWEEAAKRSRSRLAVSKPRKVLTPRGRYTVELVKPLHGDPFAVYASAPGIKVHDYRPGSREIDAVKQWKPW